MRSTQFNAIRRVLAGHRGRGRVGDRGHVCGSWAAAGGARHPRLPGQGHGGLCAGLEDVRIRAGGRCAARALLRWHEPDRLAASERYADCAAP
jgi:hypothetical protein